LNRIKWLVFALVVSIGQSAYSQTYKVSEQYSYGGEEDDNAQDLIKTPDGGIIMVGSTNSKNSVDVGNSQAYRGNGGSDFWVIKINADGKRIWSQTFGGTNDEEATSIAKTPNNEYIIVGPTRSTDGLSNFNGTNGGILMVRIKENGELVSYRIIPGGSKFTQKTFHYSNSFSKPTVKVNPFGFIYIGGTFEIGTSPYRAKQFFLAKLTPTGDTLWEKVFGSAIDDQMSDFTFSSNGDIIMVGSTSALTNQIEGAGNGNLDILAIKVTSNGHLVWEKGWGGEQIDAAHGIIQNHDKSGFLIVGETSSTTGIVSNSFGSKDALILSIDNDGNLVWKKQFGGEGNDNLFNITEEGKDKYLAFGTSDSRIKGLANKGPLTDVLTLKLTSTGEIEGVGLFGGEDIDVARRGIVLNDTTWALAAISRSSSEDLNLNNGENDFWLLKLGIAPPIDFFNFRGFKTLKGDGEISWRTNYEIGAKSIDIQKSRDNKDFLTLKSFDISGNSSDLKPYTYLDTQMAVGPNYYRLIFYNLAGKVFIGPYLNIDNSPLAIQNNLPEKERFTPYPNPAIDKIAVSVYDETAHIFVTDLMGEKMPVSTSFKPNIGWQVYLNNLQNGSYLILIKTEEKTMTKRFLKY
jgi:hypothetical protein